MRWDLWPSIRSQPADGSAAGWTGHLELYHVRVSIRRHNWDDSRISENDDVCNRTRSRAGAITPAVHYSCVCDVRRAHLGSRWQYIWDSGAESVEGDSHQQIRAFFRSTSDSQDISWLGSIGGHMLHRLHRLQSINKVADHHPWCAKGQLCRDCSTRAVGMLKMLGQCLMCLICMCPNWVPGCHRCNSVTDLFLLISSNFEFFRLRMFVIFDVHWCTELPIESLHWYLLALGYMLEITYHIILAPKESAIFRIFFCQGCSPSWQSHPKRRLQDLWALASIVGIQDSMVSCFLPWNRHNLSSNKTPTAILSINPTTGFHS